MCCRPRLRQTPSVLSREQDESQTGMLWAPECHAFLPRLPLCDWAISSALRAFYTLRRPVFSWTAWPGATVQCRQHQRHGSIDCWCWRRRIRRREKLAKTKDSDLLVFCTNLYEYNENTYNSFKNDQTVIFYIIQFKGQNSVPYILEYSIKFQSNCFILDKASSHTPKTTLFVLCMVSTIISQEGNRKGQKEIQFKLVRW